MKDIQLLYRDEWLVAINKPAGLLVHRSREAASATRFAVQETRDRIGQRVYPVHRLDRPTSGVLLFALDPTSAERLSLQFRERRVCKRYLAVVRGFAPAALCIDHALKDRDDPEAVAREARTELYCLGTVEWPDAVDRYPTTRYSLVEARPLTGRRHQLRRHLKHIDHPIIGDSSYGKARHNRYFRERFGFARLALHAWSLELSHPEDSRRLCLRAAPDEDFSRLLECCGWPLPRLDEARGGPGKCD